MYNKYFERNMTENYCCNILIFNIKYYQYRVKVLNKSRPKFNKTIFKQYWITYFNSKIYFVTILCYTFFIYDFIYSDLYSQRNKIFLFSNIFPKRRGNIFFVAVTKHL